MLEVLSMKECHFIGPRLGDFFDVVPTPLEKSNLAVLVALIMLVFFKA